MEFMDDTLSPKYQGLQNCVFAYNVVGTGEAPSGRGQAGIRIRPNPSANGIIHIEHQFQNPEIRLFDLLGRPVDFYVLSQNEGALSLQLQNYTSGLLVLEVNGVVVKFVAF